jgi:CRP/FNR family transcriptional regulator, anaerobic regulatory protein
LLQNYINTFFLNLNQEQANSIANLFITEEIKKGSKLLNAGTRCTKLSFVHSGLVRIYTSNMDKEITQWISSPGYFCTDLASFMFGTSARWHIQALTDLSIYTITIDNYKLIANHVASWPEIEKMFLVKCFTLLEERIYSHLSMSAEQRYLSFFQSNPQLFNEVPLQYIASMLGMTAETFSRIRKKQLGKS